MELHYGGLYGHMPGTYKLFKTVIIFIAFLLLLAGCYGNESKKDIVIGVAWPFELNGSMFSEGVDLAVKEINESGGIRGRNIRMIKKDDQASVSAGMAIAQSFVENPEIVAVIGHRNSFVSIPASRIYQEAGIVMLSPASTAPELTQKGYGCVFRNIPSDDEITRQLALYAARNGCRRMVIYYAEDSYGMGLANSFEDHAKAAGIKIVDRISYYGDLNDLDRLHNKWKSLDFDSIFVGQSMPAGAEFIADAGKAGISTRYIAGNAMDSPQLCRIGGEAAEGTVVGTIFNPDAPRDEVKKFVQNFSKEYGKAPGPYSAQGYDAVKLLAAAIEKAGSTEPRAIAEQMRTFKDWPGVAGYHTFDKNGNDTGNLVVKKVIRNGKFEYID